MAARESLNESRGIKMFALFGPPQSEIDKEKDGNYLKGRQGGMGPGIGGIGRVGGGRDGRRSDSCVMIVLAGKNAIPLRRGGGLVLLWGSGTAAGNGALFPAEGHYLHKIWPSRRRVPR